MTKQVRYYSVAIALHWIMALGFIFMVGSGWLMVNGGLSKATQFDLYQIHKAAGVVMLWAIVARMIVRLLNKVPALPSSIPNTQQMLANLGHIALYAGLIIVPLSGWVMVSSSPYGLPTFVFFDWIKWPHIPGLARNSEAQTIASIVHWYTVLTMLGLLVAHIGAVVLHNKKHKVQLIKRMWWS